MKSLLSWLFLSLGIFGTTEAVFSQTFSTPSGCRTTTLKNTLLFPQQRTASPNETNVVLGAFTIFDDDVPEDNPNRGPHCPSAGPIDHHPTHVTLFTVTLTSGDLIAADFTRLRLVHDANGDGFFQLDQDRQIGPELNSVCLFSRCVFNSSQSQPLLTVPSGSTLSILVVADVGPKMRPGSNIAIQIRGEANDIVESTLVQHISSDFNEAYRSRNSNIVVNASGQGCTREPCPSQRGSGSYESSFRLLKIEDLLTRFHEKIIQPGTREVIAAVLYLCEGGAPMTGTVTTQPLSLDVSQIKDYPNVLVCRHSINPDQWGTRLLRLHLRATGNTEAIGRIYLYDDANDNGILFEKGELVWRTSLTQESMAVFGTLDQALLAETRSGAYPSAGHYAPQTNPPTRCTPNVSDGASVGCPHLLVITFDVRATAQPGPVTLDINLEVGDLPGETASAPTASSNLIPGNAQEISLVISGEEPRGNLRLIKKIAEYSGDPLRIDDSDMLYALRQWTLEQPIDGMIVTDEDVTILIQWWKREKRLASAQRKPRVQIQTYGQEIAFIVTSAEIAKTTVAVYDLHGRTLFQETVLGKRVIFRNAAKWPNGVYIWVLSGQTMDGRMLPAQVQKLVLLR
jgi:hypothetical protein